MSVLATGRDNTADAPVRLSVPIPRELAYSKEKYISSFFYLARDTDNVFTLDIDFAATGLGGACARGKCPCFISTCFTHENLHVIHEGSNLSRTVKSDSSI